jgi:TonB family protein
MPPASKTTYGNVLNLASDPAPKRTFTASKRRAEQSATRSSSSTVRNKKSSTWLYASLVGMVVVAAITWAAYSHFADRGVRASETPPSLPPVVGGRDTSQVAAVSHGSLDQAPRVTTEVVTTASAASLPLPPSSPVTKDEKKVAAKASNLDRFEAALKGSVLVSQTPTRPAASARGSGEETAPEVQVAGSPTTLTDALNVSSTSAPVLKQSQIVPSRVLSMIPPTYPEDARRYGIQGAVVINAIVKKTGVVDDVRAVSGPPMLYNAAISAVRRWRYKPALSNGEPVDSNIQIVLQFKTAQ